MLDLFHKNSVLRNGCSPYSTDGIGTWARIERVRDAQGVKPRRFLFWIF